MEYSMHKCLEAQRGIADHEKCSIVFLSLIDLKYKFPFFASPSSQ